jgi:hypothetical protein
MADPSSIQQGTGRATRAGFASRTFRLYVASLLVASRGVALGALVGCAQVLGIPSDPEVVPSPPPVQALSTSDADGVSSAMAPGSGGAPADPTGVEPDTSSSDDVIPPENVSGIPPEDLGPLPAGPLVIEPDASAPEDGDDGVLQPPPEETCDDGVERVPIDVVFIVDNAAGMRTAATRFEGAVPDFAEVLDVEGVDYRLILLSRHRQGARDDDELSATATCIAAPVSGVADCPSERPAPGPRFFPYSTSIDAAGSLDQALAAFSQPDVFGVTSVGWSEWLRLGSRKVFIEISDGDSTLPGSEFVSALARAAPEHFNAELENPGFVFHSIIGVSQKRNALDIYAPDEPIESGVCSGDGTNPANAGEGLQELSRATQGLRQSICPATVMSLRLQVIAIDVVRRSFAACE